MDVQQAGSKVYFENTIIERPKQIEFGAKGKYCSIPCKNAQYDKETKTTNIGLYKFPDNGRKPDLYRAWYNKIKNVRLERRKIFIHSN